MFGATLYPRPRLTFFGKGVFPGLSIDFPKKVGTDGGRGLFGEKAVAVAG